MASIARPQPSTISGVAAPGTGLTEQEARARRQRGEENNTGTASSRSYWVIARANLFSFFNNLLFAIGVALIALGRYNDALTSVGLGLINAFISTVQEIRAKRQLVQRPGSAGPAEQFSRVAE